MDPSAAVLTRSRFSCTFCAMRGAMGCGARALCFSSTFSPPRPPPLSSPPRQQEGDGRAYTADHLVDADMDTRCIHTPAASPRRACPGRHSGVLIMLIMVRRRCCPRRRLSRPSRPVCVTQPLRRRRAARRRTGRGCTSARAASRAGVATALPQPLGLGRSRRSGRAQWA